MLFGDEYPICTQLRHEYYIFHVKLRKKYAYWRAFTVAITLHH